jgi:hypothetical protein
MLKASYLWVLLAAILSAVGCSNQIIGTVGINGGAPPCSGSSCACAAGVDRLTQTVINKIDLLLMVGNSGSMADKQALLALAIPDLVNGLVNPICLDDTTQAPVPAPMQPTGPLEACPFGSTREFPPVLDMHVGVLSSSLGSFGTGACPDTPPASCPSATTTPNDDHGHLVTRTGSCSTTSVPTYQGFGFLAWDPMQKLSPPGEAELGGLLGAAHDLVAGVGSAGCAFRSQNEAWYRFLVDPAPWGQIALVNNQVKTSGIDEVILQQRQRFLRPDSALVIVVASDADDGSLKEQSSYPLFADPGLYLPHARLDCFTKGPTDLCCASCGQATPSGCGDDPMCASNPSYGPTDENLALQTFGLISDKQRFGIEFFYPPSRYVNALKSQSVTDADGKDVPNPIFTNLDPTHDIAPVRDSGIVMYATLAGVPWQLLARQKGGVPDLIQGVSTLDPTQVGGFKTAHELSLLDVKGNIIWDDIAADPENYVPSKSPFMFESTTPRQGTDPITGALLGLTSTNAMNGHERTIGVPPGDIEYACIFPLAQPIDESHGAGDCGSNPIDNPLCAPNPSDGGKNTLRTAAKAYPGLKHLAIARGMGDEGIAASICAAQTTDPASPDFGYRPAMTSILDRVKQALHPPCLPRVLKTEADGQATCLIVEGRHTGGMCACDPTAARSPLAPKFLLALPELQADPTFTNGDCFCEITQTSGAALADCRTSAHPTSNGWCYVDATQGPEEAAVVADCPADEPRELRFVGRGQPADAAALFITCSD